MELENTVPFPRGKPSCDKSLWVEITPIRVLAAAIVIPEVSTEYELLAPRIENQNNQFTKAIMFAKVPFELTTKEAILK